LIRHLKTGLLTIAILLSETTFSQLPKNHGKIHTKLFSGTGSSQPLVVLFGGSEGGNTWAQESQKEFRDRLTNQGYAVLTIGYFGLKGIPNKLDRISLDAISDSVISISNRKGINHDRIALVGISRGAELVLNLASRYEKYKSVVAVVPSHISYPRVSKKQTTSSWTYNGSEVPFAQITHEMIKSGGWSSAFEKVISNAIDVQNALIPIEHINGPILLISAKDDTIWPSFHMSNLIVEYLKTHEFKHGFKHIPLDGDHGDLIGHLDLIFDFLKGQFDNEEKNADDKR